MCEEGTVRYVFGILVALFLLAWLSPADNPASNPDMSNALTGLAGALGAALRWYATLDHAFEERLWQMMSGELRAVLGALKCLNLLLVLWGLYALQFLRRLGRRIL